MYLAQNLEVTNVGQVLAELAELTELAPNPRRISRQFLKFLTAFLKVLLIFIGRDSWP